MSWPFPRQGLQRLLFELGRVALDIVEDLPLQDEVGSVDPALGSLGLLGELLHVIAVEFQVTVAGRRPHRGERRQLPVVAVEAQQRSRMSTSDTPSPQVSMKVSFRQPGFQALDPSARLGVIAGLHQVDRPVGTVLLVRQDVAGIGLDGHIAVESADNHASSA